MSPEKLGQHFLTDTSWRERIARSIRPRGGAWLEIGAGHGEMTAQLARAASRVVAIEIDARLAARLRKVTAPLGNVSIVEGDVLALDLALLLGGETFSVYGNLPYYITSPILHRLFEHADRISAIHVVMQFEVAARITAKPGRREYGYLSAACQYFTRPEIALRIPPGAFRPRPKVISALVSMRLPGQRAALGVRDDPAFLAFIKECFAQKRKMLRNNLRARFGERTEETLTEAKVPAAARAEQLTLAQFAALFRIASADAQTGDTIR